MKKSGMKIRDENLIHVKLEYEEAVQSKRDVLSSERDLIRLAKAIRKYHYLRKKELDTKLTIYRRIKELKSNLTKLNQVLPKIKMPEFLKREEYHKEAPLVAQKEDKDLEFQLQEIQEKLRRLG